MEERTTGKGLHDGRRSREKPRKENASEKSAIQGLFLVGAIMEEEQGFSSPETRMERQKSGGARLLGFDSLEYVAWKENAQEMYGRKFNRIAQLSCIIFIKFHLGPSFFFNYLFSTPYLCYFIYLVTSIKKRYSLSFQIWQLAGLT